MFKGKAGKVRLFLSAGIRVLWDVLILTNHNKAAVHG